MHRDNKYTAFRFPPSILVMAGLLAILLPPSAARAAMTLNSYSAAKHHRFYSGADKTFIGDPHDWSGVGHVDAGDYLFVGYTPWATMISDSYFVSAEHYHPDTGASIYFYYGNSSTGGYETRTVASGRQIAGTDLWLGKLTAPVSADVAKYPILRGEPFQIPSAVYDNRLLYTFGMSNLFETFSTNMRLGRNQIDPGAGAFRYVSRSGGGTSYSYTMDYNTGAGGLGADESYLENGDSGGPSFAIVGGAPALVGIHTANGLTSNSTGLTASADVFVPYYVNQIAAAMAGSGESPTLVPEPGALALLVCAWPLWRRMLRGVGINRKWWEGRWRTRRLWRVRHCAVPCGCRPGRDPARLE